MLWGHRRKNCVFLARPLFSFPPLSLRLFTREANANRMQIKIIPVLSSRLILNYSTDPRWRVDVNLLFPLLSIMISSIFLSAAYCVSFIGLPVTGVTLHYIIIPHSSIQPVHVAFRYHSGKITCGIWECIVDGISFSQTARACRNKPLQCLSPLLLPPNLYTWSEVG